MILSYFSVPLFLRCLFAVYPSRWSKARSFRAKRGSAPGEQTNEIFHIAIDSTQLACLSSRGGERALLTSDFFQPNRPRKAALPQKRREPYLQLLRARVAGKQDGQMTFELHPLPPLVALMESHAHQEGHASRTCRDQQRQAKGSQQQAHKAACQHAIDQSHHA